MRNNFIKGKYWRLISASAIFVALILLLIIDSRSSRNNSACGVYRKDKVVTVARQRLDAEIAASPSQHEKGLGGRPCILSDQAMLFVFEKSGQYKMWMKDMKFAIDIIWVSADHKSIAVERNVKPSTYPDMFVNRDKPAKYVIEMRANRSSELGITLGTAIQF